MGKGTGKEESGISNLGYKINENINLKIFILPITM